MYLLSAAPKPEPQDVSLLRQIQQHWNQGSHEVAIGLLRTRAEEGQAWAAALLSWLLMQQGQPGLAESVTWALFASERGLSGQLSPVFNQVVAHVSTYPELAPRLEELFQLGLPWVNGIDVISQGWNLASNGQFELGLRVMMLPVSLPHPLSDSHLNSLTSQAHERVNELQGIVDSMREHEAIVEESSVQARAAIQKSQSELETSALQAGLLVTVATSDATNSHFQEDAKRNTKESRAAWISGLCVLGVAAIVALLPVILHYGGIGANYSSFEQIALHLVSTAALATFAGVVLARARSRDHAAQRANDLATAMGTMIAYSNQIRDQEERQRFMTLMGQMILQAHLSSGSKQSGNEESVMGMVALANLIKPTSVAAPVSAN